MTTKSEQNKIRDAERRLRGTVLEVKGQPLDDVELKVWKLPADWRRQIEHDDDGSLNNEFADALFRKEALGDGDLTPLTLREAGFLHWHFTRLGELAGQEQVRDLRSYYAVAVRALSNRKRVKVPWWVIAWRRRHDVA